MAQYQKLLISVLQSCQLRQLTYIIDLLRRYRVRKMREDGIFWGHRRDLWEYTRTESSLRDGNEREGGKKSSAASKPEGAEGNKGKSQEKRDGEERREWENRSRAAEGGGQGQGKKKKRRGEGGKVHKDATLRCATRWTWRGRKISRGWNSGWTGTCVSARACIESTTTSG